MEDLIACLYPFDEDEDGYALRAVEMPENLSRLLAATERFPDLPGRGSRESTAPLDDSENITKSVRHSKGLQLTFTHGPKAGPGFVLGTDRNSCDIVLPALPHISRRHCYLTFDAERRLIVRDCSTNGTIVEYDRKGGKKRCHFTWIISGHRVPNGTDKIVIQLDINLRFQIVVSKPLYPDLYLENVNEFLQETAMSTSLPFGALGIQSNASTAAPSGMHTPNQDRILLEQETLGKGSFSTVVRVWDVSTGVEYASKRFHNLRKSDWRKEASIMRHISHEHMVLLHFITESPHPQLILEYLPLGNLEQQHSRQGLSEDEVRCTLVQGLSALTYLHGQMPPIVHRDIKPENLLVRSRDPLHIKLGDFGLSKASEDLETFCGTLTYLAPEVARYYKSKCPSDLKYTRAVDIWSFGVVIFQYAYELPHPGAGGGLRWCQKIVKRLNDRESDGLVDILLHMVVMDAQGRRSAEECLENALKLESPIRSSTPWAGSYRSFQAGSASPTEKFSTRELYELRDSCSKRQRSPAGNSDENCRTMKPFSHVLSVSSMSVLRLLTSIQGRRDDCGIPSSHTSVWIDTLCQHLERLKITELKTHANIATERTIVTAVGQTHEFTLANFTSSDCANSIADLAQYLAGILQLMSLDTTNSPNFSENPPCSQDNRAAPEARCIKAIEKSVEGGTRNLTATARELCDSNRPDKANETQFVWPADSTYSWSTVPDRVYPTTFPSALLDDTNISGCTLPLSR